MAIQIPIELVNRTGPGWAKFVADARKAGVDATTAANQAVASIQQRNQSSFLDDYMKKQNIAIGGTNALTQGIKTLNQLNITPRGYEMFAYRLSTVAAQMPGVVAAFAAAAAGALAFSNAMSEGMKANIPEYVRLKGEIESLGRVWSEIGQVWASDERMTEAARQLSHYTRVLKSDLYEVGTGAKSARAAIGEFLEARGLIRTDEEIQKGGVANDLDRFFSPGRLHRQQQENINTLKRNAQNLVGQQQKEIRDDDGELIRKATKDLDRKKLLEMRDRTELSQKVLVGSHAEGTVPEDEFTKRMDGHIRLLTAISKRLKEVEIEEERFAKKSSGIESKVKSMQQDMEDKDTFSRLNRQSDIDSHLKIQTDAMSGNVSLEDRQRILENITALHKRSFEIQREARRNEEQWQDAERDFEDRKKLDAIKRSSEAKDAIEAEKKKLDFMKQQGVATKDLANQQQKIQNLKQKEVQLLKEEVELEVDLATAWHEKMLAEHERMKADQSRVQNNLDNQAASDFRQNRQEMLGRGDAAGAGGLLSQLGGNISRRDILRQQSRDALAALRGSDKYQNAKDDFAGTAEFKRKEWERETIRGLLRQRGAARRAMSGRGDAMDDASLEQQQSQEQNAQRQLIEKQIQTSGMSVKQQQEVIGLLREQMVRENQKDVALQQMQADIDILKQASQQINQNQQRASQRRRAQNFAPN